VPSRIPRRNAPEEAAIARSPRRRALDDKMKRALARRARDQDILT
jgi:hypothetical protein